MPIASVESHSSPLSLAEENRGLTREKLRPEEKEWPSILCVDDDPNVLSALQRGFRRYQVRLHSAYHGMQGILDAVERRPDLIITDLAMPLATGEELTECLTSHPNTLDTPILVLTGHPQSQSAQTALRCGCAAILEKPLRFETLLAQISRFIELRPILSNAVTPTSRPQS